MPLPTTFVGSSTRPRTTAVDVRATMAYAAGIDDTNPAYLDTAGAAGVVAHPLFAVSPEWPAVLDAGRLAPPALTRREARASVHVTHDLVVHRLVRPGDELHTVATVRSITAHRAGAFEVLRLTTTDALGAPVASTDVGMLFLGTDAVDADGTVLAPEPRPGPVGPAAHVAADPRVAVLRTLSGATAHIYTECARIWNPIHTDPVVAHAAGLPAIILHGTATLAMAVSAAVEYLADGDPARVRRIRCRFGSMVTLPSTIEIRLGEPQSNASGAAGPAPDAGPPGAGGDDLRSAPGDLAVPFVVADQAGDLAVRDGTIDLAPAG